MWILFKIFGLLIGWNKWLWIKRKKDLGKINFREKVGDQTVYISHSRNRTILKVEIKHDLAFTLHPETLVDKFYKDLGISTELEVGDASFDKKVYLGTDSKNLVKSISQNDEVKMSIQQLFKDLALRIKSDTGILEAKFYGSRTDMAESAKSLAVIAEWLNSIPENKVSFFRDPNFIRVMAVEFWITGIAFYGIVSLIQNSFSNTFIIELGPLVNWGFVFLIIGLVISVPLMLFALKRASRSHLLITENIISILVGFPFAGFYLANDLNRYFDTSQKEFIDIPVVEREYRPVSYRRRAYFNRFHYNASFFSSRKVNVDFTPITGINETRLVSVRPKDYNATSATATIRQGYLGSAYVEKITFD